MLPAGIKLTVREGEKNNVFKVKRTFLYDKVGQVLGIEEFLDMITAVYRHVRPVEKKRKEGTA